jgi:hypothetical protein
MFAKVSIIFTSIIASLSIVSQYIQGNMGFLVGGLLLSGFLVCLFSMVDGK